MLASLLLGIVAKLLMPLEGPRLYINPQRINDEEGRLRRLQLVLDDDPEYRQRVKLRMMKGLTELEMAPLYSKGKKVAVPPKRKPKTRPSEVPTGMRALRRMSDRTSAWLRPRLRANAT